MKQIIYILLATVLIGCTETIQTESICDCQDMFDTLKVETNQQLSEFTTRNETKIDSSLQNQDTRIDNLVNAIASNGILILQLQEENRAQKKRIDSLEFSSTRKDSLINDLFIEFLMLYNDVDDLKPDFIYGDTTKHDSLYLWGQWENYLYPLIVKPKK